MCRVYKSPALQPLARSSLFPRVTSPPNSTATQFLSHILMHHFAADFIFTLLFIVIQLAQVAQGTKFRETSAIDRPSVVISHDDFFFTTTKSASNTHIEPSISKAKTTLDTSISLKRKRSHGECDTRTIFYKALGRRQSQSWTVCPGDPTGGFGAAIYAMDRPCGPCSLRVSRSGRCVWSRSKCGDGRHVSVLAAHARTLTRTRTRTVTRRFRG